MTRQWMPDLVERCARNAAVRSNGVLDSPGRNRSRPYASKRFSATLTVMYSKEDKDALFALARRRGCRVSDLVRQAIKHLLAKT